MSLFSYIYIIKFLRKMLLKQMINQTILMRKCVYEIIFKEK